MCAPHLALRTLDTTNCAVIRKVQEVAVVEVRRLMQISQYDYLRYHLIVAIFQVT